MTTREQAKNIALEISRSEFERHLSDLLNRYSLTYEEIEKSVKLTRETPTKEKILSHLKTNMNLTSEQIILSDKDEEVKTTFERKLGLIKREIIKLQEIAEEDFSLLCDYATGRISKENEENPYFIFEKEAQAKEFIKKQPLFFDRNENWFLWDKKLKKYTLSNKTDILIGIKSLGVNVINSKERTEILNALQLVGRENIPEEVPKECIQFKDRIVNVKTGEMSDSTPSLFSTNPIPWNIGETQDTPTMDKLFAEWVGKEYVETLYEIIAYCSISDQFLQRMIAFVGGGANGKGTFLKLIRKFLGEDNCSSSELELLSSNQFETSSIYKKLLCEMGEVSYEDLKNTNQIKKLSGEDKIRYCFKGKTPFTDSSPTTCIINTNSLPTTKDKTTGFYRRWLIVDFPNQFPIREGIIESIPEVEFENLSNKIVFILSKMYETQSFTNEGNYQERANRYEERSNPLMRFVEKSFEEEPDEYFPLKRFKTLLTEFLNDKHLRVMSLKEIKKSLAEEGFEVRRGTKNYVTDTFVFNLKLKNIPNIPNIHKSQINPPHENLISKKCINGIKCIKPQKSYEEIDLEVEKI